MSILQLPQHDGSLRAYTPRGTYLPVPDNRPASGRVAYAAAHVVADPLADNTPGRPARIDWDTTMGYRHHLWRHGFGVADAMDTAQRGMGLDWAATRELIRRSGREARSAGGRLACGAGTDQLRKTSVTLADVIGAYEEQCAVIEEAGATIVLMASRQLAAVARDAEDYLAVYDRILTQVHGPVVVHWLGPMFDPQLSGYWGSADPDEATETVLRIVYAFTSRIDGVKISLLDADREIAFRRRLPAGVRCYTGDDFHYPELIKGDGTGHSDALLGIFDAIAPVAAAALRALDNGDEAGYDELLAPTVRLSRCLFAAPAYHYKTGIVFLAWLAGHQDHFTMVGGLQNARTLPHLAELLVLADEAGLLADPDRAADRMRLLLKLNGVAA
jgi:hypothetical protein